MITSVLDEFKSYLAIKRNCRPITIYRYLTHFKRLLRFVPQLTYENLETFIQKIKEEGKSASYREDYVVCARVVSMFYKETKRDYDERVIKFPLPKKEETYKGILTDDEIDLILTYPRQNNEMIKQHKMWNLFFSIMAFCGIRPGELSKCRTEHIDWGRLVFTLEAGMVKTKRPRLIPIPSILVDRLKDWTKDMKPKDYLFMTHYSHRPVHDAVWWYEFDKRLKYFNLKRKGITPYSLRHTFCTRLLEEDVNLFKIMKNMGHSDPRTTLQYSHLTTKDLHTTIKSLPVLAKKLDPSEKLQRAKDFLNGLFSKDSRFKIKLSQNGNKLSFEADY